MLIRPISLLLPLLLLLSHTELVMLEAHAQPLYDQLQSRAFSAPVIVDGRPLFRVYGTSTIPPKQRAREISERIRQLAADAEFDPATLELREFEGATGIYFGDEVLMYVFKEDASIERALSPRLIARKVYVPKIAEAISQYRLERDPKVLLKHGLHALLRTLLLFFSVWFVLWGFKKINLLVEQRYKRKLDELEAKSKKILQARQVWTLVKTVLRITRGLLLLVLVYLFITLVLDLFPWTRYISRPLLGYLINPIVIIGESVIDYLPNLFFSGHPRCSAQADSETNPYLLF